MDANKTIKQITEYGSVIVTTLLSFIVKPPSISNESTSPIHYNNLYIFIIGVLSILLYNRYKNQIFSKISAFILLPIFIVLIIGYGFFHEHYTVNCSTDLDKKESFIVSYSEDFKTKKVKLIYDSWKINEATSSDFAIKEVLRAKDCNPSQIWSESILYPIFIFFVFYYIIIAIILIILIHIVSDEIVLLNSKKKE